MVSGKYSQFYDRIKGSIPKERILHDALSTLAFGTDASFYRLIPKIVIKANCEDEVRTILKEASELDIPVTFRAAGTSLSGQAISDSVLVITTHGWKKHEILENGSKIKLQPGVIGAHANRHLAPYGKKIGPDPASIDSAMIGGIAANNASGMCCGTSENSYKTVEDIRVIFADGTILDTSDKTSVENFKKSHSYLIESLESLANEINSDENLREKIRQKFKIKNTTGYSLNAFTDYKDGIDIIKHILIGSEGTLAFISDITFRTVIEEPHKALALIVYKTIQDASNAVSILKKQRVSAVELLDRAALKSVEDRKGVPAFIRDISPQGCVLLVEATSDNIIELDQKVLSISQAISPISTEIPYIFTTVPSEQTTFWKIRKETLPTVAGVRKSGTTAIIEDVCFPVERLAEAVTDLQEIFKRHRYDDAVIFGHALEGNLHFMFNQDFGSEEEVSRYSILMDDIADLVVDKYDGSLKAEHGTGRNMAPFVEKEWGEKAYKMMKRIKEIFDAKNILNPGVILNDDSKIHIKNLKPLHPVRESVDKCMECGFCEHTCVSEGLTLSPRQRVAVFREMERLRKTGEEPHICAEMHKNYKYWGLATCATDSLCAKECPVDVDSGKLVKELRHEGHSPKGEKRAVKIASSMGFVTGFMRFGLKLLHFIRTILGKRVFGAIASFLRAITFKLIPRWNEYFPNGAKKISQKRKESASAGEADKPAVVYFPSCITRAMGVSKNYSKEQELTELTESLLLRAGYRVIYPDNLDKLCCGMAFSSKGYVEAGKKASDELKKELIKASENGKYPILCDMSPCLYTMWTNFGEELKLYEPAEFADKFLLDKLPVKQVEKKVAVFAVCSAKKLSVDQTLYSIAQKCAKEVVIVDSNCCGFAGDRGFLRPELNDHGLRMLKDQVYGCDWGYATSRTCEIGLSSNSKIPFSSILYLIDEASRQNPHP